MNSNKAEVATWRTSDLSPWFLRDTVHIPASYDYKANCYFNVFAFDTEDSVIFDAGTPTTDNPVESGGSCWIHSASYFCQGEKTTTTTTTTLEPAKCDSLPYTAVMCPSGLLKANQSTHTCDSSTCIDSDANDEFCCEDKARCDTYQPLYCPSGALVANAAEVKCSATTCTDGTADDILCCQARAKCDTYEPTYCPSGMLVGTAATTECSTGTTCTDGDADDALCCEAIEESTTLDEEVPAGTTSLEVGSDSGFEVGREVVIDPDNPEKRETNEVADVGTSLIQASTKSGSLVLLYPLQFEHSAGVSIIEPEVTLVPTLSLDPSSLPTESTGLTDPSAGLTPTDTTPSLDPSLLPTDESTGLTPSSSTDSGLPSLGTPDTSGESTGILR